MISVSSRPRDEGVDDFLDEALIDRLAVSLTFDQSQDGTRQFSMLDLHVKEEVVFPLDEGELHRRSSDQSRTHSKEMTDCINRINSFSTFVAFALYRRLLR